MGKFFRLKAGSHHTGNDATDTRIFKSNDPQALKSDGNIVESDEDLAVLEPTRWEEYRGEIPERLRKRVGGPGRPLSRAEIAGEPPPPGPTTASDIAEAADLSSVNKMTPEELEKHAEALIERAEAMKQRAAEAKQAQQQNEQKVKEVRASRHEDEDDDEEETSSPGVQRQPSPTQGVQRQPVATEKVTDAALDRMSLEDLKAHAKTKNIDLKGATKREDILKTVKASK